MTRRFAQDLPPAVTYLVLAATLFTFRRFLRKPCMAKLKKGPGGLKVVHGLPARPTVACILVSPALRVPLIYPSVGRSGRYAGTGCATGAWDTDHWPRRPRNALSVRGCSHRTGPSVPNSGIEDSSLDFSLSLTARAAGRLGPTFSHRRSRLFLASLDGEPDVIGSTSQLPSTKGTRVYQAHFLVTLARCLCISPLRQFETKPAPISEQHLAQAWQSTGLCAHHFAHPSVHASSIIDTWRWRSGGDMESKDRRTLLGSDYHARASVFICTGRNCS
jgi:hypothetical protein